MSVLGIDVSGPGGGAALLGPDTLRLRTIPPEVRRGRDLVPIVSELLNEAGIRTEDLAGIACAVGPGSFTGIRIGIATAGILAHAAGLEVVGVGSLDGIAMNAPAEAEQVLVVLDARRGEVFAGRFTRTAEGLFPDGPYRCLSPEEAVADLPASAWVLGDARARHPGIFGAWAGTSEATVRPDVIAQRGSTCLADGAGGAPENLRPLYLRLSDPEIRRREREGGV